MSRSSGRQGLLIVGLLLFLLLLVADLLRPNSFVRSEWNQVFHRTETPAERMLDRFRSR